MKPHYFSTSCVLCNRKYLRSAPTDILCDQCQSNLHAINRHVCRICGRPLFFEEKKCTMCRHTQFSFQCHRSLFEYTGAARNLLIRYKQTGNMDIAQYFSRLLAENIFAQYKNPVIIPVPVANGKLKKKGWDQIERIAGFLERKFQFQVLRLLKKEKSFEQKKLSASDRRKFIRKSITLIQKKSSIPESVIVLDDVFTTGSTVDACAVSLKEIGVKQIFGLTICLDF